MEHIEQRLAERRDAYISSSSSSSSSSRSHIYIRRITKGKVRGVPRSQQTNVILDRTRVHPSISPYFVAGLVGNTRKRKLEMFSVNLISNRDCCGCTPHIPQLVMCEKQVLNSAVFLILI